MRRASECLRTSGACVSNQYFWNSSRDSCGSLRRQKLSLIMPASVSRGPRALPGDHDLRLEPLAKPPRRVRAFERGEEVALELLRARAEEALRRRRMRVDAAEDRRRVALE